MALIDSEPGIEVAGQAADGVEAVSLALSLDPNVIIMDMMMPNKDGIEATKEIVATGSSARILALTSSYDDSNVVPAVRAGASGYLLKDSSPIELIHAIREVAAGKSFLQPSLGARLIDRLADSESQRNCADPLTSRETGILQHVATGASNQEIADALNLSERTVGKHITNILAKLNLSNRTQAALYALRNGIVHLDQTLR